MPPFVSIPLYLFQACYALVNNRKMLNSAYHLNNTTKNGVYKYNRNNNNNRQENVARSFFQHTHIHGLSDLARSNGDCVKLIWLAVIAACSVGAGFEIYRVFKDFRVGYAFY